MAPHVPILGICRPIFALVTPGFLTLRAAPMTLAPATRVPGPRPVPRRRQRRTFAIVTLGIPGRHVTRFWLV